MAKPGGSNDNFSFSSLLKNPSRDDAELAIRQCVLGLRENRIPRGDIARALKDYFLVELTETKNPGELELQEMWETINILTEAKGEIDATLAEWDARMAADDEEFCSDSKPGV